MLINQIQIFGGGPPCPTCLSTSGARYRKFLSEPRVKVRHPVPKLCNKQFAISFFPLQVPDHVHRPTAAPATVKNCRLMALQTPNNRTPHYKSQFCVSLNFWIDEEA